jgi:hypothetical protein
MLEVFLFDLIALVMGITAAVGVAIKLVDCCK